MQSPERAQKEQKDIPLISHLSWEPSPCTGRKGNEKLILSLLNNCSLNVQYIPSTSQALGRKQQTNQTTMLPLLRMHPSEGCQFKEAATREDLLCIQFFSRQDKINSYSKLTWQKSVSDISKTVAYIHPILQMACPAAQKSRALEISHPLRDHFLGDGTLPRASILHRFLTSRIRKAPPVYLIACSELPTGGLHD